MSSTDQYDKENDSPKPPKRALYSYDGGADEVNDDAYDYEFKHSTATAHNDNTGYRGGDGDMTEDLNLNAGPPSSPFQFSGRDDTVDMSRLQAMTMSTSRRMSPQKNLGPEIYVDEEDRIDGEFDNNEQDFVQNTTSETTPEASESHSPTVTSYNLLDINDDDGDGDSVVHNELKPMDNAQTGNSIMEERLNEEMSTVAHFVSDDDSNTHVNNNLHDNDSMDDTCFSTFSAVPNVDMTLFAKLGASPTKRIVESSAVSRTPGYARRSKVSTPATAHRRGLIDNADTSPTPQRRGHSSNEDSMNLLDFNDSINYFHRVSQRFSMSGNRAVMSPRRRSPFKPRESMRSPGKYNLIDFDVPPPATPMSIPSITLRELESLKSGFLSEISSLKATVSGKEAEVSSLKQAVADAERRVGEALEEVRNEAIRKEALEVEQAEWERRGKEMETVLRDVRAEIIDGECERERLTKKNDEAERLKEQLEGKIVELESQLDAAKKAAAANPVVTLSESNTDNSGQQGVMTAEQSAKEVQEAVERVARELHTLYKGKHETKVAALKKSYESRWEKRVREAENKLREASEEVERLKTERDASMSGPLINPNMSVLSAVIGGGRENEELETENKVLGAQIKGLEEQLAVIKRDNEQLHADLKLERSEKGELVAAVDEWLAIQQAQSTPLPPPTNSREVSNSSSYYSVSEQDGPSSSASSITNTHHKKDESQPQPQQPNTFRRSISRSNTTSGLRPPSSGNSGSSSNASGLEKRSRLGMYGGGPGHVRNNSGGNGRSIAMPSSTPGRSGIMSSIERMGMGGR
jgi:Fungal Transforming acidic coiled-coil (TACC) proteins